MVDIVVFMYESALAGGGGGADGVSAGFKVVRGQGESE